MSASVKSVSANVMSVSMVMPWDVRIWVVSLMDTVLMSIPARRRRSTTVRSFDVFEAVSKEDVCCFAHFFVPPGFLFYF